MAKSQGRAVYLIVFLVAGSVKTMIVARSPASSSRSAEPSAVSRRSSDVRNVAPDHLPMIDGAASCRSFPSAVARTRRLLDREAPDKNPPTQNRHFARGTAEWRETQRRGANAVRALPAGALRIERIIARANHQSRRQSFSRLTLSLSVYVSGTARS